MIKSARVMKKAVAHLIPFMEEEREARFKALGETMVDSVSYYIRTTTTVIGSVAVAHLMQEKREARFKALGETMVDLVS